MIFKSNLDSICLLLNYNTTIDTKLLLFYGVWPLFFVVVIISYIPSQYIIIVAFLAFPKLFDRLMYWCEVGADHKIEAANMDGDDRRILVKRGLYYPNGLTLDDSNNRLYWVDSYVDALEYYDLERHTITTLLDRNYILSYPFGLTSLDDHLYWTDWNRDAVYQADKETALDSKVVVSGFSQPMDIHAYDRNETLPGEVNFITFILAKGKCNKYR